jgi:hypothetical protein
LGRTPGAPNVDSDVDFLVLKNFSGSDHEHYVKIRTAVEFPFAVDLLVRRPDVVRQRIKWNDFFLQEIMEKGIVLYAANDKRMGDQGRRRLRRRLAALKIPKEEPVRPGLLPLSAVHWEISERPIEPLWSVFNVPFAKITD